MATRRNRPTRRERAARQSVAASLTGLALALVGIGLGTLALSVASAANDWWGIPTFLLAAVLLLGGLATTVAAAIAP